jgi:hypothetical protein
MNLRNDPIITRNYIFFITSNNKANEFDKFYYTTLTKVE